MGKNYTLLKRKKAFTLVELLVAITILTTLIVMGTFAYGNAQIRARDAKRKQDLKTLATALQLYYNDHGTYPAYCDTSASWFGEPWDWNNCSTDPDEDLRAKLAPYLNPLPTDPVNIDTGDVNIKIYMYEPSNGGANYRLATKLENSRDRDINCSAGCGFAGWYNYYIENPN
jgi:prepilin-type N-terminal cleavage/methylation domain-containing protein